MAHNSLVRSENTVFKPPLEFSMVVFCGLDLWEHPDEIQSCEGSKTGVLAKSLVAV